MQLSSLLRVEGKSVMVKTPTCEKRVLNIQENGTLGLYIVIHILFLYRRGVFLWQNSCELTNAI
ncbi:MAG: hypothetical protein K0R55_2183 [Sporomusa sp.]|nr:hypothetical protein [Sporomusa sp.]